MAYLYPILLNLINSNIHNHIILFSFLQRGYTFVAEARTIEYPVVANKCKMRLIASLPNMPAPVKNEVNCAFQPHEIKNYYIPNEKNIILRSVYHYETHDECSAMNYNELVFLACLINMFSEPPQLNNTRLSKILASYKYTIYSTDTLYECKKII